MHNSQTPNNLEHTIENSYDTSSDSQPPEHPSPTSSATIDHYLNEILEKLKSTQDKERSLRLEHSVISNNLQVVEAESVEIASDITNLRDQIRLVEALNKEVVQKGEALSEILIQFESETKSAEGEYHKLLASKNEVQKSEMGKRADEVKQNIRISKKELFNLQE